MLTITIINTIIICLACILFIAIGASLKQLFPLQKIQSPYFQMAVNFFIGCTFFIFSWLVINLLLKSVELSLYTTTGILLVFLVCKPPSLKSLTKRSVLIVTSVILLVNIIGFARAFDPMPLYLKEQPELVNPFLGFGTAIHSFRASNITQFILENDSFPILGQHSFQGVLASVSAFSAFHSTQLSLILWLNTFISFSIFLIYGFLRHFLSKHKSIFGTLLVILGNTLLSPFYTSITDIDRATLRTTNYETLFGIATIFIAILIVYFALSTSERKNHYPTYLTFFVFGFVWNIASGHMVLVLLALLALIILYYRFSKNETIFVLKVGGLLTLGCLVGAVTLGGMFSSGKVDDIQKVPGMMNVIHDDYSPISLRFPRTSESGVLAPAEVRRIITQLNLPPEQRNQTMVVPPPQTSPAIVNSNPDTSKLSLTQRIKGHPITFGAAKIIRSIQVVFFPLLGILLAWYLIRKRLVDDKHAIFFRFITIITTVSFLFGWIISSVFTVYIYYWELSRFLYLGAFLSMIVLAISGSILYETLSKLKKICLLCIFVFILIGPSTELVLKSVGDYILAPEMRPEMTGQILDQIPEQNRRPMTPYERFEFLIYSNYMYGTKYK